MSAIVRRALFAVPLGDGTVVERLEVAEVTLAPGQASGRHRHPCPVVGCVTSGAVRVQVDGQDVRTVEAGNAFYEPAGERIVAFDNVSDTDPAVFIAFYLLPPGEERLILMEN